MQWRQPTADLSAFWGQLDQQLGHQKLFENLAGPREVVEQASKQGLRTDLLSLGIFPSLLGLLLLIGASVVSGWFYRGDDSALVRTVAAPHVTESTAPSQPGDASRQVSDLKYAPPGRGT